MRRIWLSKWCAAGVLLAAGAAQAALLDYEGFNYNVTAIHGLTGGTGWNGNATAYVDTDADYSNALSNDGVSLNMAGYPFASAVVGSRVNVDGGEVNRNLSAPGYPTLNAEGNTVYVSFLMRKNDITGTTGDFMELDLLSTGDAKLIRLGISDDDKFYIQGQAGASTKFGTAVEDVTYYVVGRIKSHPTGTNDELSIVVYGPGTANPTLPDISTLEPAVWDATISPSSYNNAPAKVRLETGIATPDVVFAEFDEIRVGTTWMDVAVPEPATLSLLALGVAVVARRRRRA